MRCTAQLLPPCQPLASRVFPCFPQVLDYQNCSHTLLPLIASAYALWFMGDRMMAQYKQFEADRDAGEEGITRPTPACMAWLHLPPAAN